MLALEPTMMTEETVTTLLAAEFKSAGQSVPQDWAALARWLARSGAELGPTPGRQFAGGFGNLNYLIEIDGKPAVLRRPPGGPLPLGANVWAANTISYLSSGTPILWPRERYSSALSPACSVRLFRSSSTARVS